MRVSSDIEKHRKKQKIKKIIILELYESRFLLFFPPFSHCTHPISKTNLSSFSGSKKKVVAVLLVQFIKTEKTTRVRKEHLPTKTKKES